MSLVSLLLLRIIVFVVLFKDVLWVHAHLLLLLIKLLNHPQLGVQLLMPSTNFILLLFGLATGL